MQDESKIENYVNKSKIRFAFKSFILSQISLCDSKNLIVKLRNNFNVEIVYNKILSEDSNKFKLKINNILNDDDQNECKY